MNILALIFRWLMWTLLVTFESVVGFPWLSFYVAGEWVVPFRPALILVNLGVMSVIFSAVYSLPLSVPAVLLVLVWQAMGHTRKNTWRRLMVYWLSAILIGVVAELSINTANMIWTMISFGLFFKLSGGKIRNSPWQVTKLGGSSTT